jgi:hypothetical protein
MLRPSGESGPSANSPENASSRLSDPTARWAPAAGGGGTTSETYRVSLAMERKDTLAPSRTA